MRNCVGYIMTCCLFLSISRQRKWCFHLVQASNAVPTFASFVTRIVANEKPFQCRSSCQNTLSSSPLSAMDYDKILPKDIPRRKEILVGLEAVSKACSVAKALQPNYRVKLDGMAAHSKVEMGVMKADLSPVTIADFAVQALVLSKLHDSFKRDAFIAEESSDSLKKDHSLAASVLEATERTDWTFNDLFSSIDLGKMYEDENLMSQKDRVWTCDPIDGTRGFLRGRLNNGQYCVALCMIECGSPVIGILGCPNLVVSSKDDWEDCDVDRGCIFVASALGGSYQVPMFASDGEHYCRKMKTNEIDNNEDKGTDARFCLGVEKYGNFGGKQSGIAQMINGEDALDNDGEIIKALRMDSQVKYGVIARGDADIFLRFTKKSYEEWIWDHAAGGLVIAEAGGLQSDVNGFPLDFSQGAKLPRGIDGIIATSGKELHAKVINSYRTIDSLENDK